VNWQLSLPDITPNGQRNEVTRDSHKGMEKAHSHSPNLFELYFEAVSYPGKLELLLLIKKQKPFIEQKSSHVSFSVVGDLQSNGFQCTSFMFESDEKTRKFMLVDNTERTHRTILNPLSGLNLVVLGTLMLKKQTFAANKNILGE